MKKTHLHLKIAALAVLVLLCLGASDNGGGCIADDKEYYKLKVIATCDDASSNNSNPTNPNPTNLYTLTGYYIIDSENPVFIDQNEIVDVYKNKTYYTYTKNLGSFTNFSFDVDGSVDVKKLHVLFYMDDKLLKNLSSTRSSNSSGGYNNASISFEYTSDSSTSGSSQ